MSNHLNPITYKDNVSTECSDTRDFFPPFSYSNTETMATFFGSSAFISHPLSRSHHIALSSQTPPSPPPSSTHQQSQSLPPPLSTTSSEEPVASVSVKVERQKPTKTSTSVDSTDWIASNLTRRFGLGAGLAWAAFLAVGVVSEQIKTRLEVSQEAANTRDVENEEEVVLPNGIRYFELRVGGGATPKTGDLVVIDLKGKLEDSGQVFVDTFGKEKKPLALVMGQRPYTRGMCEGVEYVLRSMKSGGRRRVIIPPSLGFGNKGADLDSSVQIPPSSILEYVVEVEKVSIAPA